MDRTIYQTDIGHVRVARPPEYLAWRMPVEQFLAALLLVLVTPLLLVLMALVRITSPGGVIFRQTRLGKNGRPFEIFKLRTMYDGAEKFTGPVWCQLGDSRVTPLGQVLRKLHLDELPQLVNVIRGEMSLIGPRPERPVFVEELVQSIPNYAHRLQVRPGITGLAQIRLPPDVDETSVARKVELDLEYIRTASLGRDLAILLITIAQMLGWRRVPLALPVLSSATTLQIPGRVIFDREKVMTSSKGFSSKTRAKPVAPEVDDSQSLVGAIAGSCRLAMLLVGCALATTAAVAQASIIVPPLAGSASDAEFLASLEERQATTTQASSRQYSRPLPSPPTQEEGLPFGLSFFIGTLTAGDTGSMSGTSVLTKTSGGDQLVAASANYLSLPHNPLVVWSCRSNWLAIPTPKVGSLLRPPQSL